MKKIKLLLVSLTTLSLMACNPGDEGSSQSDINSNPTSDSLTENDTSNEVSSEDSSEEESSEEETPLPKTLDEVVALVNASLDKSITSLSFKDFSSTEKRGNVKFADEGTLEQGIQEVKENTDLFMISKDANKNYEDYLIYKGFDSNFYYDINSNTTAEKYNLVENVADKNLEITLEDAKSKIENSSTYNLKWLIEKSKETFTSNSIIEGVNPLPDKDDQMMIVRDDNGGFTFSFDSISSLSSNTYHTVYKFDSENNLVSGSYYYYSWKSTNIDSESHKIIDSDQNPNSMIGRELSNIVYGEEESLNFDVSPYFISELSEVFVSTTYDSFRPDDGDKNKAEIGYTLDVYIVSYLPTTALDAKSFKVLSSDNEDVIRKSTSAYNADKFEAVASGIANVVVGDKFGLITKIVEVTVVEPPLSSFNFVFIPDSQKTFQVDESLIIQVNGSPAGANKVFTVEVSDPNVIEYEISEDYKSIKVTGVNPGTATITATATSDPSKIASMNLTIIEKIYEDFLIGTFTYTAIINNLTVVSTLTLNDDKTGSLEQVSIDHTSIYMSINSTATFNWSYNGEKVTFTNWIGYDTSGELYFSITGNPTLNADKTQLTFKTRSYDYMDDKYEIQMVFDLNV